MKVKEETTNKSFKDVGFRFLIGFLVTYALFILDILMYTFEELSVHDLESRDQIANHSIFLSENFYNVPNQSSTVRLLGPGVFGYMVLFTIPIVSTIIIAISWKACSTRRDQYSFLGVGLLIILADPIVVLAIELKLEYYFAGSLAKIKLDTYHYVLSLILFLVILLIFLVFGWLANFSSGRSEIDVVVKIIVFVITMFVILIYMYLLAGISNASYDEPY